MVLEEQRRIGHLAPPEPSSFAELTAATQRQRSPISTFDFTALSEPALSDGNIASGSTFTMQGIETAIIVVIDDDGVLLGDRYDQARDTAKQTGANLVPDWVIWIVAAR